MTANRFRNLRIYSNKGQKNARTFVAVDSNTSTFRKVRGVLNRGLGILETSEGRQGLVDLAAEIIIGRWAGTGSCLYDRRDNHFRYLPHYIDLFLRKVRQGFPHVYLSDVPGKALTRRFNWAGLDSTLEDYVPYTGCEIYLDRKVISDMITTTDKDIYNSLVFQMAVSVAHELGHVLTNYLSGTDVPETLSKVKAAGLGATEAGRGWESQILGSVVEFHEGHRRDEYGITADIAYVFPDFGYASTGVPISSTVLADFRKGVLTLPIRGSSKATPVTRRELCLSSYSEMADLLKSEGIRRHRKQRKQLLLAPTSKSGLSRSDSLKRQTGWYQYGVGDIPGQLYLEESYSDRAYLDQVYLDQTYLDAHVSWSY